MQIGEAASRAGVNIQTLRYYERRGLLPEPARSSTSNYRMYTQQDVGLVRLVRDAQSLGFTLDQIRELFALAAGSENPCVGFREQAMAKLTEIDAKIRSLQGMRELLEQSVDACPTNGSDGCTTLKKLKPTGEPNDP